MHLDCAAYAFEREWRLSRDEKSLLMQIGENDEPV
jgi:hypothetical protein